MTCEYILKIKPFFLLYNFRISMNIVSTIPQFHSKETIIVYKSLNNMYLGCVINILVSSYDDELS